MLLNSGSNAPAYWGEPLGYSTETFLDDVSKRMAASNLIRRHSRGASGQKGGSMRIIKTGSAGISPRSSTMLNRRKTLMSDSPHRRGPLRFDQNAAAVGTGTYLHDKVQTPPLANRPVSWHASSHLTSRSSHQSSMGYLIPKTELIGLYNNHELTSTPAMYSSYASPASTFSPLSQPVTDCQRQVCQDADDSFYPNTFDSSSDNHTLYQPLEASQQAETYSFSTHENIDPSMYSHFGWSDFTANDFDSETAPPTPENFLPIQQPNPSFEAEDKITYHPLDDSETGEILVGMGLYDKPEKSPAFIPPLENYHSLIMSQLLGTPYRKYETPTGTGKGLKLEETWNPPSDDGEDAEDGDSDEDAEGSETDETPREVSSKLVEHNDSVLYNNHNMIDTGNGLEYGRNGWL